MSLMLAEIREQPDIIMRVANQADRAVRVLADEVRRRAPRLAVLAARGTSDHAAIYGKYLMEINNAIPVALADCSVFTIYKADIDLREALVIGVSQSGQAQDVSEYLARSRKLGALTAAITNEPNSPITRVVDHTLLCGAGTEKAVAATKTYTATLALFYLLSWMIAGDDGAQDRLRYLAEQMRALIGRSDEITESVERYRYMQFAAIVSRGINYATALEIALKLAETSYVGVRGYSAADFLHGPIATIHEGDPCMLIAPPGKAYESVLDLARKLRDKRAEIIVLSSESNILDLATARVDVREVVDEQLSPMLYVAAGQLFAERLSVVRGHNPDQPRGLSKVTSTF
jgi:glucosamine--fructose-6-phosphate aminotransferase (isomerizing)